MTDKLTIDRTLLIFSLVIMSGAFLVFLVQPMVARMLLPELGGAPIVWNASQVFFQFTLLLGYGYAHLISSRRNVKTQMLVHTGLLAIVALTLPFSFDGYTPGSNPVAWMLSELFVVVFPVFFLLTATSPLLQAWIARTDHPDASDPYFLYSASNIGSLLGLFAYPFLLEPTLALGEQAIVYAGGFVLVILLFGVLAFRTSRHHEFTPPAEDGVEGEEISVRRALWWIICAAVPSGLMLAFTNKLTLDIASVPLLWIGPLSLYLISFIIVFSRRAPDNRWFSAFVIPLSIPLVISASFDVIPNIKLVLPFYLLAFLLFASAFHGELARTRPAGKNATRFYLLMSFGGILGGGFVALVAPVIFHDTLEFEILMIVSVLAAPFLGEREEGAIVAWGLSSVVGVVVFLDVWGGVTTNRATIFWVDMTILGVVVLGLFARRFLPRATAAIFASLILLAVLGGEIFSSSDYRGRSYFGTVQVDTYETPLGPRTELKHGTTVHGSQYLAPEYRDYPLSYYSVESGIGRVLRSDILPRGESMKVAAVGLGVGTLAVYSRKGEDWDFIEIDPLVAEVASNPEHFTFVSQAAGDVEIKLGDGRLVLEEYPNDHFDLIIMDAYSSDSIPLHLLTREAVDGYLDKLSEGGVLAFHLSNRVLSLEQVAAAIAEVLGVRSYHIFHQAEGDARRFANTSSWFFIAERDDGRWEALGANVVEGDPQHLWTDNYVDLFSHIKW